MSVQHQSSSDTPDREHAQLLSEWFRQRADFWFGLAPPHSLCLFRIFLGGYFLVTWLGCLPYVELNFSRNGMAFPFFEANAAPIRGLSDLIAILTQPPSPFVAWILYFITIGSIFFFTIGLVSR